ncbi:MAG: hypothetical protein COS89_02835 [Deltaproteobacteria bacterium CG07_land_8_20_14_0_80_38_7]|nr:MAG: hypothetical protein COS89_02835 [Deltaproteobacteria bacterium CG07_land_8_20_14_0_80_38_7]
MNVSDHQNLTINTGHDILKALKIKNFRIFFIGQGISFVGTWSQAVAISWLVWTLTESGWWLGFTNFAIQIPILLFGLLGGFLADKYSRRPLLIIFQILCMSQAIALSILAIIGVIKLWHIIALSLLLGTVYAIEFPLRFTFIMDMVSKKNLLNAISLNSAAMHLSRIMGPVIAGFIINKYSEPTCFIFNAFTFIFLIAALFAIDKKP